MNSRKVARLALLSAISLILGLIESRLPPLLWFAPYVRLGLANVVALFAIFTDGAKVGCFVLTIKCVLVSLLSGNPVALIYSLTAGLISYWIQYALIRYLLGKISVITVAFIGAAAHNFTQLIIAALIVGVDLTSLAVLFLPASAVAGLFTGTVTYLLVKRLPVSLLKDGKTNHGGDANERF